MSEEALRRVLERLNSDAGFRERMQSDWESILDELELSPTELFALTTYDEDALRRLAAADVTGFMDTGRPPLPRPDPMNTAFMCTVILCTQRLCFTDVVRCGAGGGGVGQAGG